MECVKERSYWRDKSYSEWHRKNAGPCPCTDIDTLITSDTFNENMWNEYNHLQEPVALIEAKMEWTVINIQSSPIKANSKLGDMAGLPFLIVKYNENLTEFDVLFHNQKAKEILKKLSKSPETVDIYKWHHLTEKQYITLLQKLRKIK